MGAKLLLRLDLHFFEVRRTIERFWTPAKRFALRKTSVRARTQRYIMFVCESEAERA